MPDTKEFVNAAIANNKVVIFSKNYCPFCKKALAVLREYLNSFLVVELTDRPDMDDIQNYMRELTGAQSVPRVFIGGKFVGGGDDVVRLHKTNQLKPLLESAGAL